MQPRQMERMAHGILRQWGIPEAQRVHHADQMITHLTSHGVIDDAMKSRKPEEVISQAMQEYTIKKIVGKTAPAPGTRPGRARG